MSFERISFPLAKKFAYLVPTANSTQFIKSVSFYGFRLIFENFLLVKKFILG